MTSFSTFTAGGSAVLARHSIYLDTVPPAGTLTVHFDMASRGQHTVECDAGELSEAALKAAPVW